MKKSMLLILFTLFALPETSYSQGLSKEKRMFVSARKGDLKGVKHLVEKEGVNVNYQDELGYTALMIAASKGNLAMVRYLEEHGANINLKTNEGQTALDIAIIYCAKK